MIEFEIEEYLVYLKYKYANKNITKLYYVMYSSPIEEGASLSMYITNFSNTTPLNRRFLKSTDLLHICILLL